MRVLPHVLRVVMWMRCRAAVGEPGGQVWGACRGSHWVEAWGLPTSLCPRGQLATSEAAGVTPTVAEVPGLQTFSLISSRLHGGFPSSRETPQAVPSENQL